MIASGHRVLDCGCGLGGVVADLNERFDGLDLTGLNVDRRQLTIARDAIGARAENTISFVHAASGARWGSI
jgi:cyclopropane fatty-acyl-phospholipid synthase-like methyltransferase